MSNARPERSPTTAPAIPTMFLGLACSMFGCTSAGLATSPPKQPPPNTAAAPPTTVSGPEESATDVEAGDDVSPELPQASPQAELSGSVLKLTLAGKTFTLSESFVLVEGKAVELHFEQPV